jgi:uncharacterized membrane protein YgaE (UPF0421/DUF939 family)
MGKINRNTIVNSIKIILAAIIAIIIVSLLKLEFAISAGIVAILTIQPTKKETVKIAMGRLCAFAVALVLAYVCFLMLDFTIVAFFVYLFVYIFVCQMFSWNSAMAMNSVLISHFITAGSMDRYTVGNELAIFIIGVGCGIIANLHLRKRVDFIEKLKMETRRYAKRQLTWFKKNERINWIYPDDCADINMLYDEAERLIKNFLKGE